MGIQNLRWWILIISPLVFGDSFAESLAPRRLSEIVVMVDSAIFYEDLNRMYIIKAMPSHRKNETNPT